GIGTGTLPSTSLASATYTYVNADGLQPITIGKVGFDFQFDNAVSLTPGSPYYFIISPVYDITNIQFAINTNNPYTDGVVKATYTNGTVGGPWDWDLRFSMYGCGNTEPPMIVTEAQNQTEDCGIVDTDTAFNVWLANNGGAVANDNSGDLTWSNNFCNEITRTIDGDASWIGYNNRFDGTNYVSGNQVDLQDVSSAIMPGNIIVLQPSLIEPTTDLTIEGNTFIEDHSLAGQSFTFNGNVTSNTLDSAYESVAFIKLFDSGYGFIEQISVPLNEGPFTVAYNNTQPDAVYIQLGFALMGPGAQGATDGSLGTVVVEATPSAECVTFTDECGGTGSATVTFTATDAAGLTAATTATFTIKDETPPNVITDCPTAADFGYSDVATEADLPTGDEAEIAFFEQGIYGFYEDTCSGLGGVNISNPVLEGDDCGGTATYTIDFADGCGNYNRGCSFTINYGAYSSESAIWNGAINSDWTEIENWQDNLAPGLSINGAVTIPIGMPNYPVLNTGQDLTINPCSMLTVESDASLRVNPNVVVTNNGTVTNNGSMTFESDATGSAYIGSGTGMFIGDFT
ncbi:hypothetical protein, partial [Algibacter sp.]|uniref:hypothetical protein n=1 Tax=Algibacter sp. TaxID=1872428 RepID=UPI003C786B5C